MPKTFTHFFTAASSLFVLFSCNTNNNVTPKTGNLFFVDSLINQTQKFGPESAAQAIAFIDSTLAGKNLTLEEKVAIYGHKSMVYREFLNNNAKAELYADSALYLAGSDDAREKCTELMHRKMHAPSSVRLHVHEAGGGGAPGQGHRERCRGGLGRLGQRRGCWRWPRAHIAASRSSAVGGGAGSSVTVSRAGRSPSMSSAR